MTTVGEILRVDSNGTNESLVTASVKLIDAVAEYLAAGGEADQVRGTLTATQLMVAAKIERAEKIRSRVRELQAQDVSHFVKARCFARLKIEKEPK